MQDQVNNTSRPGPSDGGASPDGPPVVLKLNRRLFWLIVSACLASLLTLSGYTMRLVDVAARKQVELEMRIDVQERALGAMRAEHTASEHELARRLERIEDKVDRLLLKP